MASDQGVALGYTGPATAADFAMSPIFKAMPVEQNSSAPEGFAPYLAGGTALGCKVDADRKNSYKTLAYVVPSAAGLAGGIFRLPNSFVTPIVGGRNVVYMTTLLLCVPCVWMALALSNPNVAYLQITIAAMTSGVGGGAFASSMANISPFFPKRQQGYGLGMNGGLGNLGVSLCQLFLPILFVTGESWNSIGGTWISNGGWFLFPCCLTAATIAFFFMNNMPKETHPVPDGFFQMFRNYASFQARLLPRHLSCRTPRTAFTRPRCLYPLAPLPGSRLHHLSHPRCHDLRHAQPHPAGGRHPDHHRHHRRRVDHRAHLHVLPHPQGEISRDQQRLVEERD